MSERIAPVVIGPCTLYLGDCLQVVPTLSAVDAVITDPPYGINQDKGMGGGGYDSTGKYKRKPRNYAGGWDSEAPAADTLVAVIASAEKVVIWGGNYLSLPVHGKWLVWNKCQVMPTYSDAELAWTNLPGVSVEMFTYHCNKARMEAGLHPTQKPVALMAWCMEKASLADGAKVVDPYMGSGTTGIACIRTGRKFVGIEKDAGHFATAVERITRELQQQTLAL